MNGETRGQWEQHVHVIQVTYDKAEGLNLFSTLISMSPPKNGLVVAPILIKLASNIRAIVLWTVAMSGGPVFAKRTQMIEGCAQLLFGHLFQKI